VNNLQLTPTVRSDGVATHVWKNTEGKSKPKKDRTKNAPVAPPKPVIGIPDNADRDRDFITNIIDINKYVSVDDSWEAREEITKWAQDVAEEIERHPNYLPTFEPDYYEDPNAEPKPITIKQLRKPEIAEDQCFDMSRGVAQFAKDVLGHDVKLVQGIKEYDPEVGLYHHYATLVTASNGVSFVVDYTFAQLDKKAPFPLVEAPDVWLYRVNQGLKRRKKKRRDDSWNDAHSGI
jgi:hypothetical protein